MAARRQGIRAARWGCGALQVQRLRAAGATAGGRLRSAHDSFPATLTFIERLKALPFIEAIYLFGSCARGTQRERSDIDLAVVCPAAAVREWPTVLDIVALDRLDAALALPPDAPLLIDGTMQRFGSERVEAFLPREMRAAD